MRPVGKIDTDLRATRLRLAQARAQRDLKMIDVQQDKINDLLEERWKAAGNG